MPADFKITTRISVYFLRLLQAAGTEVAGRGREVDSRGVAILEGGPNK